MKKIIPLITALTLVITPLLAQATRYSYDDLNRLKRADYPNGVYVEYNYDAGGNILAITSLVSMIDSDGDGDGVPDSKDAFPNDPLEWADDDADLIGDNADLDDDNDGLPDLWELANNLDPFDETDANLDNDNDSLNNLAEYLAGTDPFNSDTDADGVLDGIDYYPLDSTGSVYSNANYHISANPVFLRFTHNKHTYDVFAVALTATEAFNDSTLRFINGEPGYLARIDDIEENTAILNQLSKRFSTYDFSKTTAPDGGNDGDAYIWLGASETNYNNRGNKLDDFGNQGAIGLSLNGWDYGVAGQWNDLNISNQLYYIVEYDTDETVLHLSEGNSNHTIYFNLNIGTTPFQIDVSVDFITQEGTAKEGQDYIFTSGTATIYAETTGTTIPVTIIGDRISEGSEVFNLMISNPRGAKFPEGISTILSSRTIDDDD